MRIAVELTPDELRYLVQCGSALAQHVPVKSLPTYCGFTKEQVVEFSLRMRELIDANGLDM